MREIQVRALDHRGARYLVITLTRPRRNREPQVRQMWLREDEAAQLAALLTASLPPVEITH